MNLTFIPTATLQTNRSKAQQAIRRNTPKCTTQAPQHEQRQKLERRITSITLAVTLSLVTMMPVAFVPFSHLLPTHASGTSDQQEDVRPQLKVAGGSASTAGGRGGLKTVTKTVTRGITLEKADFSEYDLEGVSFQQSILRQADFSKSNLRNASFFDADLTGAKFVNAEMSNVNLELANVREADLTGANLTGAYISSTTKLNGAVIDNSDWTDTLLRKDQQQFLCAIAKGTNPITGVDTRDSLFCP